MLLVGVVSKGFKGGEDNENGGPAVVEREWEMDEDFIGDALRLVEFLDDIVDVCNGRRDEERKDES